MDRIREQGIRLAPWHLNVEITPKLCTRDLYELSEHLPAGFYDPGPPFKQLLRRVYPNGLEGRSVLDCACNNGSFLFAAKEIGAGRCFGTDVREQWIEQARFLLEHRDGPSDDMEFRVLDLYELPTLGLEPFDITIFSGIHYHLPDPIRGLEVAGELTRELMYVAGAAISGYPDGHLVASEEPTSRPLSGVYGLHWFPTGPAVLARVLRWIGFADTRCLGWRTPPSERNVDINLDMVHLFASREPGSLASIDSTRPGGLAGLLEVVQVTVPPRATLLIASGGRDEIVKIEHRRGWHYPQNDIGEYDPSYDGQARELIRQLEKLREQGASYLVVPWDRLAWLEAQAELRAHLELRYQILLEEADLCLIYDLRAGAGCTSIG